MANLSEVAEETIVHAVQHVPGTHNPADIPTRDTTTPEEVMQDSVWQQGPSYLTLPRNLAEGWSIVCSISLISYI